MSNRDNEKSLENQITDEQLQKIIISLANICISRGIKLTNDELQVVKNAEDGVNGKSNTSDECTSEKMEIDDDFQEDHQASDRDSPTYYF